MSLSSCIDRCSCVLQQIIWFLIIYLLFWINWLKKLDSWVSNWAQISSSRSKTNDLMLINHRTSSAWASDSSCLRSTQTAASWLTEEATKRGSMALVEPYEMMKKTGFTRTRLPDPCVCVSVCVSVLVCVWSWLSVRPVLNACCGRKRAECVCHPSEKLHWLKNI